jgi:hypothetical protein
MYRSPDIYITVEENSGKYQLEDHPMKAVRPFIVLKWCPLHPNDFGRFGKHVREGEGKNKGKKNE